MQLVDTYDSLPRPLAGAVVVLGNFDGVHLGHAGVIQAARQMADEMTTKVVVLTFEPHPRSVFAPHLPPFRLTPKAAKARFLAELGVAGCVAQKFDSEFSEHSAEDFVRNVLIRGLQVRHLVVGADFRFGKGRKGDVAYLQSNADRFGFMTSCVEPVLDPNGVAYSSTRVREALTEGDVETAASILGRPFQIEGMVVQGEQRGRTIGFPTANILLGEYIRPKLGVYAVRAEMPDGKMVSGVANIGKRPTVNGLDERLEVHLFDFSSDIYGKNLNIHLQRFIRPEQKFANFEELKIQIVRDAETARHALQEEASARL